MNSIAESVFASESESAHALEGSRQEMGETILIVDDTPIDAALTQGLLEQRPGTRAVVAVNGEEALQVIEQLRPDLVVTDLQMPGMDGLELVEAIQRRFSWLPTILMTAHGSEEVAAAALQRGAASYVRKRDLASRLASTVDDVLAISGTSRRREKIKTCWTETTFNFCLDNDFSLIRDTVSHLQQYAKSMLRMDDNAITRVGVALHESLTNAMLHGNLELDSELRQSSSDAFAMATEQRRIISPYRDRRVYVTATESVEQACYVVRDEGPGFDLDAARRDPTDAENLTKSSGRGLFLIHAFMDEVHFNDLGNEITMIHRRKHRE